MWERWIAGLATLAAVGGFAVSALADPPSRDTRLVIARGGMGAAIERFDANGDGWLTRAEAAAAAERVFDEIDGEDRARPSSDRFAPRAREERHEVRREVVVISRDDDEEADAPRPPRPPRPPRGPMFLMMIANADEADLNGDGRLSKDEFKAQQLRFFDAADANRDGRIKFDLDWAPPEAPEPPAPPPPPR